MSEKESHPIMPADVWEDENSEPESDLPATPAYRAVPWSYFLAVLRSASRRGILDEALREWGRQSAALGARDVLLPAEAMESGKRIFQALGLCGGDTGLAAVFIKSPTVTVNFAMSPPTIDVTYNAVEIVSFPCTLTPTSATLTITPPPPAAPLTLTGGPGPGPAVPPPLIPPPQPPAVDIPTSFRCAVPAAPTAVSLIGLAATITVVYDVGEVGGPCDTCASKGVLTATASTNIV
jgi:hypothetical protein